MAVPRVNAGGPFGGGPMPVARAPIDLGAAIDSLANGASSLIHNAVIRKQAERNRAEAIAQQQAIAAERRATFDAQRSDAAFNQDVTRQRLELDRQKITADAKNTAADRAIKTAELGAKGIRPKQDVAQSVAIPQTDGMPATTVTGVDPTHYEDVGGGQVLDKLHNPDVTHATERAKEAATQHGYRLSEIKTAASLRPDPRDTGPEKKRAYLAQRVRTLTTPRVDALGDVITPALSLPDALHRATEEWDAVSGEHAAPAPSAGGGAGGGVALRPVVEEGGTSSAPSPAPTSLPKYSQGGPERVRAALSAPGSKRTVTPDQAAYLQATGQWNPNAYEVTESPRAPIVTSSPRLRAPQR